MCKETFECSCEHAWKSSIKHRVDNRGCPYCTSGGINKKFCIHQSLLHTHPEIAKQWHPTKNGDLKPEDFSFGSHQEISFLCDVNQNHIWKSRIKNRTNNQGCPHCKNKTETILYDFLIENFDDVERQFKPDWCKNELTNKHLPFDFYIKELKLILELDGRQHLEQVSNWESAEHNQKRDKFKMDKALEQGVSIIRILQTDIYNNNYDWQSELLNIIKLYSIPKIIYLCQNNEYDEYTSKLDVEDLKNIDFDDQKDIKNKNVKIKKKKIIFEDDDNIIIKKKNIKIKKKKIIFEDNKIIENNKVKQKIKNKIIFED